MFRISIDNTRNLLTITIDGHFDIAQAEQLYADAEKIVPTCVKGFYVLTDLSSLESMDVAVCPFLVKTMELCNSHGVSKVIRVIPDATKDIGFNIMSLFHYSPQVKIHTFRSLAEAEEHLANP